jgi:hypothetical protein
VLKKKSDICWMAKISSNSVEISEHVLRLLIPTEILESFELKEVIENEEELLFDLIEKGSRVPQQLKGKSVVLNGFMNATTLQSFPQNGKQCYIHLRRRRWKEKGKEDEKSYHNEYEYTATGTMATKSFGAFLKRNSLTIIPSRIVQFLQ